MARTSEFLFPVLTYMLMPMYIQQEERGGAAQSGLTLM